MLHFVNLWLTVVTLYLYIKASREAPWRARAVYVDLMVPYLRQECEFDSIAVGSSRFPPNTLFGEIASARDPRSMQLALKLIF